MLQGQDLLGVAQLEDFLIGVIAVLATLATSYYLLRGKFSSLLSDVLDSCGHLKQEDFVVTYSLIESDGLVNTNRLKSIRRPDIG